MGDVRPTSSAAVATAAVVFSALLDGADAFGASPMASRLPAQAARCKAADVFNPRMMAAPSAMGTKKNVKQMRYNKLGDSDLLVSEVCLGTMTWGKQNSDEQAMKQLDCAFDEYGVNFIDTAEGYPIPLQPETQGDTDRLIGKWMKGRPRDKIILATKMCGASQRLNWFRDDGKGTRVNRKQVFESLDKSLQRLDTDYVDLFQIHWPDRYVPLFGPNKYDEKMERAATSFEEQLEALADLIKEGKIRHWGLSNETPFGVMAFVSLAMELGLPKPVSIQNSYSLLTREFESGLAEVCSQAHTNVALIPYSPLSAGVLSGKYQLSAPKKSKFSQAGLKTPKAKYEGNDPNCRLNLLQGYRERYESSLAPQAVEEYSKLAAKYGVSPTQFALGFVQSRSFVPSTCIGATSVEQLEENLQAFGDDWFTEEMYDDVEEVASRFPDPWRTPQPGGG
mmetsp:Transcript_5278/g.13482  ORF Transcript_5278/g.13482 Transcript_5278/m.13482 type:complete len:450 (-) Transcript_5278:70-1419(-)